MQPRFLMPTYPVDDFSLSIKDMFQSISLFVLHEGFILKSCINFSTRSRLSGQSRHSTARSLRAYVLDPYVLHLGGPTFVILLTPP